MTESVSDGLRAALASDSAAGKPEKEQIRLGFMPLTDCASVIMASVLGLDRKYGITIVPTRESSWAGVRDKLVNGELDAAHVIYGLVYGVHMGIGTARTDMAVLMTLNHNGQAITVSNQLAGQGVVDGASLARLILREPSRDRRLSFAHTFPTGTHAMWLYYWLAAHGVDPLRDVRAVTVPPPQMVTQMGAGNVDGVCVGEPWNHRAVAEGVGVTLAASQAIWPGHPEKVLGARADFVRRYPNSARALTAAVLEASRWIDASQANKLRAAETIAGKAYVNASINVIGPRMLGYGGDGARPACEDPACLKFHQDGAVNFPYLSDGMWFLTQHKRWGLLKEHPDYLGVAASINQVELYRQAAAMADVRVPDGPMRSAVLLDGRVWDGSDPKAYADAFAIRHVPSAQAAASAAAALSESLDGL